MTKGVKIMLRIGIVKTVNSTGGTVTVLWPDTGITSGPLYVLKSAWPPSVGDSVAVGFLPVQDGDGIVLGVVQ